MVSRSILCNTKDLSILKAFSRIDWKDAHLQAWTYISQNLTKKV